MRGSRFPGSFRVNPIAEVSPSHDHLDNDCMHCVDFPLLTRPSRLYPCPIRMKFERFNLKYHWNFDEENETETRDRINQPPQGWRVQVKVLGGGDAHHRCNARHLHKVSYPEAVTRPEASWRKMFVTQPPVSAIEFDVHYQFIMSVHDGQGLTFDFMDNARKLFVADPINEEVAYNSTIELANQQDTWEFVAPDMFADIKGLAEEFDDCCAAEGLCGCQEPLRQALLGHSWEGDAQRTIPFERNPSEWPKPVHTPADSPITDWGYGSYDWGSGSHGSEEERDRSAGGSFNREPTDHQESEGDSSRDGMEVTTG